MLANNNARPRASALALAASLTLAACGGGGGGGPGDKPPASVGRFELKKLLGRGAQATVWLALDPRLQREVAIKLMRPMQETPIAAAFEYVTPPPLSAVWAQTSFSKTGAD